MKKLLIGTALAAFAFAQAANAAIILYPSSGPDYRTFNEAAVGDHSGASFWDGLPITWATGPNSSAVIGSAVNQYLAPLNDATTYIFATAGSDATVNFGKSIQGFRIYWGSPDTYNVLTLSNGHTITGSDVAALFGFSANGDNANTRWVGVFDSTAFTGFTASSPVAAFEFDATAAPEPATWALMLAGFAGLAFAGHRSRKQAAVAA
jgi:hypothetical protein